MPDPLEQLTIRAFKAPDEPDISAQFLREHVRVLEDLGITNVPSNNARWITDPNCYVITAEHERLGMVGGLRIQTSWKRGDHLPMRRSVGKLDPGVDRLMDELSITGIGELCGLWNAHRFANRGLPQVLGMVGISIAPQLGVRNLTGLLARYTLKYALRLGFSIFDDVGQSGIFDYPRPGFLGIVCGTTEALSMSSARPDLRQRIISLRLRPEQEHLENTGVAELYIRYKLHLRQQIIDMDAYRSVVSDRLRYTA